jgi:hypothetical protein
MVLVLSLVIINFFTRTTKLNFENYDEYEKQMALVENKISTYKDTACVLKIKELIKKSKDTYFVGEYTLKEIKNKIIQNDEIWLSIYGKSMTECGVNDKELNDYAFTVIMFYEELLSKNRFSYELSLPDFENRLLGEASLTSLENRLRKDMEIKTIEYLLNGVEK